MKGLGERKESFKTYTPSNSHHRHETEAQALIELENSGTTESVRWQGTSGSL